MEQVSKPNYPCPGFDLRHKTILSRGRGGVMPHPIFIRSFVQCVSCICQTIVLCRRLGGRAPPCLKHKAMFNALSQTVAFCPSRHAKSSRLMKSASFDETKHLCEVWHQDGGFGYLFLQVKSMVQQEPMIPECFLAGRARLARQAKLCSRASCRAAS